MGLLWTTVSLRLDQDPHRGAALSRYLDVLPIRTLGLFYLLLQVGGRGLSPNGAITGVAHLLKIKTYLRKGN